MKLLNRKSMLLGIVGAILLLSNPGRAEKIVDLVQNGSFEQVGEMNPEKPWSVYHTGELGLTRAEKDVHYGAQAAHFEWRKHLKSAYSALCHTSIPVVAGTPYTLTFWARGKGSVVWVVRAIQHERPIQRH